MSKNNPTANLILGQISDGDASNLLEFAAKLPAGVADEDYWMAVIDYCDQLPHANEVVLVMALRKAMTPRPPFDTNDDRLASLARNTFWSHFYKAPINPKFISCDEELKAAWRNVVELIKREVTK